MNKKGLFFLLSQLSISFVVLGQTFEPGEITEGIQCEDESDFSYHLYLPSSYDVAREDAYPVLFIMDPGGGQPGSLQRYILGAEKNDWVLAVSRESKNGDSKARDAIEAMVEDVFERFHINERRCYASGFSGGARLAFWLANEMSRNIIGIIPCGAGDSGNTYSSRALAYGLCGGYCFNRWDMTITFHERIKKNGRLRFLSGGHVWAEEDLLFDAITWLNANYLDDDGSKEELNLFSEMLIKELQDKYERNPYFAYENGSVLAELSKAPHSSAAKKLVARIEKTPEVQDYIAALEDVEDFVDDHFNTDVMDYQNNSLTSKQEKDAAKLLLKYKDTPLAPTIEDFGKESQDT